MKKDINNSIRLGIFVVSGLFLLIVGLYFIGSDKNMFGSSIKLYTTFRQIGGLQTGNNVRYSGIDIGTVKNTEIQNDTAILVEMVIEVKKAKFVRKNSICSIGTDGLMGNKLVNIDPGTNDALQVQDGDRIPSREGINMDAMLHTLNLTNQNIAAVSATIKEITDNISSGQGTLYTVLKDTTLAGGVRRTLTNIESVSNNLTSTTNNLSVMVSDIKQGKGAVGTLLRDTVMKNDLQTIVREVKKSSEQFSSAAGDLAGMVNKLNKGNGTVATLVNDTAMSGNMKQSMSNLQSASKKLDEDLEALKHNIFFRGYFKKQAKEAEKAKKAQEGK